MAAPTIAVHEYGLRIVGGTDATVLIQTQRLKIQSLLFFPDANSGTVVITDGDGNAFMTIQGSSVAGVETQIFVDGYLDGIGADFSGSASVLIVFLE